MAGSGEDGALEVRSACGVVLFWDSKVFNALCRPVKESYSLNSQE